MSNLGFQNVRRSHGLSRREMLRVGGLSCLGLSLADLWRIQAANPAESRIPKVSSFGRAKACIVLFMTGGQPQHETFDPKPEAPLEVRGEFQSIRTKVPGLHFCELLPYTAQVASHLAIIRSMTTEINSHASSGYWMLTGYQHPSKGESEPPSPNDWPSLAAVVGALKPSQRSPFSSVVLPESIVNNPNILWPGQTGGLMGPAWNPHLLKCDPTPAKVQIEGMDLPESVSELRLSERFGLMQQFDNHFRRSVQSSAITDADRMQQKAFDLVHSSAARAAFEMDRESAALRDRYGRHKFGQSVLLARRLIETGVRLVQVNWPREPGDTNSGNPLWDTHSKNAERLRTVLCPQFDRTFATLIQDLNERGLLAETLVVVMGEFGRTPQINRLGGRDHWGQCFSIALAGAGIEGGQVIGSSDRLGAVPDSRPIWPPDLAATILHLLGINPASEFIDPLGRPRRVTDSGTPIHELVGS